MKRVVIYLRVSTIDQHPETQLYDLRDLASQRGFAVVQEYTDKISGAKSKRPGLDLLMRDAKRGRFDVVLVWAFDRMARSVRHLLETLDELNRLNVEYISFRENIDTGARYTYLVALEKRALERISAPSLTSSLGLYVKGWRASHCRKYRRRHRRSARTRE